MSTPPPQPPSPSPPEPRARPGDDQAPAVQPGPSVTADMVWAEIEASYERIYDLIESLPTEQRGLLLYLFRQKAAEEVRKWHTSLMKGWQPKDYANYLFEAFKDIGEGITPELYHGIRNMRQNIEAAVKGRFTVKPRMTARDAEVVRLRDEEGLDWDAILARIRTNPAWEKVRGGNQVKKRTLRVAYQRHKAKLKRASS